MEWQAKWIWAERHLDTPNCYLYARREVEVGPVSRAAVHVTCSSEYRLYINGRYIGRGPSPCHPAVQYYDRHDVTHALRSGRNVIAALCYNYGVGTHSRPKALGGLLLQLEATSNGDSLVFGTDESWRVKPGEDWDFGSARMFWTIGFQEVYDSRRKPVGWNVVGFDDSAWEPAHVIGEVGVDPWTSLVPRPIPSLREREVFPESILKCGTVSPVDDPAPDTATRMRREARATESCAVRYPNSLLRHSADSAIVLSGGDAFIIIDFGREVVGFPILRIRDGGRGAIDIGYSEALDGSGDVDPTRQSILQADRLILHGGRQEWQTFGRRAFRYMQLTFRGLESPLHLESVSIDTIGYPVEQTSTFECSDDLLNEIWRTGVYTLSLCMQDAYEDCPLREHGQYPGDVRVEALQNYYAFFDTKLVAKALRQFVQSQREDGLFNALWPSSTNHVLPDYNLVWVVILHDYHLYTGDRELVEELHPNMRLLLENWVRTQESENGLLTWNPDPTREMHEWWLFIDHAPLDKRGEVAAYNAFYYQALRCAAKLASSVGKIDDAVEWHDRTEKVLNAFNSRFWSEERSAYVDCCADGRQSDTVSVQTNTLAVLFGLADPSRSERIKDLLRSALPDAGRATSDSRPSTPLVRSSGPYFNFYVLQAMAKLAMDREALDLIRRDWGEMLRRGATTWWETFDPAWPDGAVCPDSLCHAWSGAPTYFLPAEVLGVKPSMPGSPVAIVQPRVGDLQWAKGCVATHKGPVTVEWHAEEGGFTVEISAPEGFIAALPVTGFENPQVEEIDLGPETPESRARRTYGWGNVIWRNGQERDPYLDWLRAQEEEPPRDYESRERCSLRDGYIWVGECIHSHVRYEIRETPEVS